MSMLEITLIAMAIPACMIGGFLFFCFLVWRDAGDKTVLSKFKVGDAMSDAVAMRMYRAIQYGLIAVATGAWGVLGYTLIVA